MRARAGTPVAISVRTEGSCPSGPEIGAELSSLLRDHVVVPPSEAERLVSATIIEKTGSYEIRVLDVVREIPDASGDCSKRANFAAVIIALALEPAAQQEFPSEEVFEPRAAKRPSPDDHTQTIPAKRVLEGTEQEWSVTAGAGVTAVASLKYGPSFGPLLELMFQRHGWFLLCTGSVIFPRRIELEGTSASLSRYPMRLSAGRSLSKSQWQLAGAVGLAVEPFEVSVEGVQAQQTRVDVGPMASLSVGYLRTRAMPFLTLDARWFPLDYTLIILPQGQVGHTPNFYVGTTVGLRFQSL